MLSNYSTTVTNFKRTAEFEVLTVVVMKCSIFWDITPYSSLKSTDVSEKHVGTCNCYLLHAVFFLGLFFGTEYGGDIFLRNIC
jgi:hypothetical protein